VTSVVVRRYGITQVDNGSPVGLPLDAMIRPALRRNPRRAQLLVSTVLGKHIPVDARVSAGVGRLLGALVARVLDDDSGRPSSAWSAAAAATMSGTEPAALLELLARRPVPGRDDVLTLGFAETATALGHLVADELGSRYLHSTRRRSGAVPVAAEFTEPHSHATGHLLRPDDGAALEAETVVLVDDELSTGATALNVIEVLHGIRPRRRYVLAGLVDVRSAEADAHRASVADRLGCRIDVVALVRGAVTVPPDAAQRIAADLPQTDPPADQGAPATLSVVSLAWPADVPLGAAHGFAPADRLPFSAAIDEVTRALDAQIGDAQRVLLVGTEEFMYLPLRIALALSGRSGRSVAFQSTTRSPVHALDDAAYPIRRRIDFRSLVDGGPQTDRRHLYNAHWPEPGGPNSGTGPGHPAEPDVVVIVHDGSELPGPAGAGVAVGAATGARVVLAAVVAVSDAPAGDLPAGDIPAGDSPDSTGPAVPGGDLPGTAP
jgi:hypothetical protein